MISLDDEFWLNLNRMVVEIGSRDELANLVTGKLPNALQAETVCWSEHGPRVSMGRARDSNSFSDAVLAILLEKSASKLSDSTTHDPLKLKNSDANHGVFDLDALNLNCGLRDGSALVEIDLQARGQHQIATQFFVDGPRGILLTVQNSCPFTKAQKFTLALLRQHLAIAARHHYRRDADPMVIDRILHAPELSRREQQVFPFLVKGFTNPEIADSLGISPRTVEKHVASILDKMGLDNRRMLIGLRTSLESGNPAAKNG